jgi:hypothetical protein
MLTFLIILQYFQSYLSSFPQDITDFSDILKERKKVEIIDMTGKTDLPRTVSLE